MIVIDASVAVKWFVEEDQHLVALALTRGEETLIAPDFVILETFNVLRRKLRSSEITEVQIDESTQVLAGTFDLLVPMAPLAAQTMALASQLDHSVDDCAYLACALRQQAVLVTADLKFAQKAKAAGYQDYVMGLETTVVQKPAAGQLRTPIEERAVQLWRVFEQTLSNVRRQVGQPFGLSGMMIVNSADLDPAFDSPAYLRLQRIISGLPDVEVIKLLALAWFGRPYTKCH